MYSVAVHGLHSSPNVIQLMKSRMRWVEHVTGVGKIRGGYRVLVKTPRERDNFEGLCVDGRIP